MALNLVDGQENGGHEPAGECWLLPCQSILCGAARQGEFQSCLLTILQLVRSGKCSYILKVLHRLLKSLVVMKKFKRDALRSGNAP